MAANERLERYLRAEMERLRLSRRPAESAAKPRPFVTISRQAGAGGHSLADVMLGVFEQQPDRDTFSGWQIVDHNIRDMVSDDPLIVKSMDSLLAEEYRSPATDFFHQVIRSTAHQDLVMARVFQAIRSLAIIGKVIIIGRAGSQVTATLPVGMRLRLVAPDGLRVSRIMEQQGCDERHARGEMKKLDASRARLLANHFRTDIDDPLGYDVVWNSESTSPTEISEAVLAMIRRRLSESTAS
jgi:cytidylate kinase